MEPYNNITAALQAYGGSPQAQLPVQRPGAVAPRFNPMQFMQQFQQRMPQWGQGRMGGWRGMMGGIQRPQMPQMPQGIMQPQNPVPGNTY